jgi:DNA-binding response OmpR family regulator
MPDYTILLIDYEPRSIEVVRQTLEGGGFRLEVAGDGVKGIEAFNRLQPDLTLVEAMLPKRHGFEVCQHLKTTSHGAVTPVAIITAVYKGRKYRNQALHQYKADEYLEKPIAPDVLLATVRRLLDASPSARPAVAAPPAAVEKAEARPAARPAAKPVEKAMAAPDAKESEADDKGFGSAAADIAARVDSLFS